MTIPNITPRNDYTGNGSTATYGFGFQIDVLSDLGVYALDTSLTETKLVAGTDYTVNGVGVAGGGNITLIAAAQTWIDSNGFLATGAELTLIREQPLEQDMSIRNEGSFYPDVLEDGVDEVVMKVQQLAELISRTMMLNVTDDEGIGPIPRKAARANTVLGFDANGDPFANAGTLPSASVSSFMAAVLLLTTAPAVRAAIGADGASDVAALTNKTISASQNTFVGLDSATYLANLTLAASVGGSALTIALKDKSGADASGTSKVAIGFRNATSTNGTYSVASVSAALSLTVASGTTLGTQNALAAYLFVYALLNGSTVELAVSLSGNFDEASLQSTTAISGGASASTLYSATARANVPIRLIGRIAITEATAGTWSTAPTEISTLRLMPQRKAPTKTRLTSTGTTAGWLFTISTSTTCAVGDTYTDGTNTYTVLGALAAQSGQVLFCSNAASPSGGTLTRSSGAGTGSISYSAATAIAKYKPPQNPAPLYLEVDATGGGAGGAGGGGSASGGNGTDGTATFFGVNLIVVPGGSHGFANGAAGAGGTAPTINSPASGAPYAGAPGGGGGFANNVNVAPNSGNGGQSINGGGGGSVTGAGAGGSAAPNTGSGGGGGGISTAVVNDQAGGGGGSGAAVRGVEIPNPDAVYWYCVGKKGTGGSAGTSGGAGGDGADGDIVIKECYQ